VLIGLFCIALSFTGNLRTYVIAKYGRADKSLARPISFSIVFFSPGNRW
jgi:hypothetical protein